MSEVKEGQVAPEVSTEAIDSQAVDMSKVSGKDALEATKLAEEQGISVQEALKKLKSPPKAPEAKPTVKTMASAVEEAFKGTKEPQEESVEEAVKEAKRKLKYKDGDQDVEVDEDEVLKVYKSRKDHQRAANKELQEGKKARQEAAAFIQAMKDPSKLMDVLTKLGHDPRKLSEEYLTRALEEELMDPKEKEYRETKEKLRKFEEMEELSRKQAEEARIQEVRKSYTQDYEKQFTEALQSEQVPQNKQTVGEMAKYIYRATKLGYKLSAKEAARLVKEDIQKAQMSLIGNADGETLLRLLGEETAQKLLQARGAKVKQPATQVPQEQPKPRERRPEKHTDQARNWAKFRRGQ